MKFRNFGLRAVVLGLIGAMSTAGVATASHTTPTVSERPPDLAAKPASSMRIATTSDGQKHLKFTTLTWNRGAGRLEIRGGTVDRNTSKQEVKQRIYRSDGTYRDVFAGFFDWHEAHGHVHFNDYAIYTLQPVNAPGASARTGAKMTFCIMDTTKVEYWSNSPSSPRYTTCESTIQGMSVGWGDKYGYNLSGQSIDITGLPNGDYALKIEVDPKGKLVESDDTNNTSTRNIHIEGSSVTW
jgi:Lysyl oxidase